MAELEARLQLLPSGSTFLWCYELPENREVTIGKTPLSHSKAAVHNRSEWVVPDPDNYVSGLHAFVKWNPNTQRLEVRRKMEPQPARNEIFYNSEAKNNFEMKFGDYFVIGRFTFQLHDKKSDSADSQEVGGLGDMTNTVVRPSGGLQLNLRGESTDPAIKALKRLPEVIRRSRKEQDRYQALLKFVISIVPQADVAAVIEAGLDDSITGSSNCRVAVRQMESRRAGEEADQFRVSRSLTKLSLFTNSENTLWVRGQNRSDFGNVEASSLGSTDWAVCAPLFNAENGRQRVGLYLVGTLPRTREPGASLPPELLHAQEVIDTAVQIYKSVHELLLVKEKVTRYEHYLPKRISEILTLSNLKETQQPRETEVTVLFCDLRGFSKGSEAGAHDLMASWRHISDVLNDMTEAINNAAGVVGDLAGDAAMGFWGWPFEDPDQAVKAARAALHILKRFHRRALQGQSEYRCGIGIAQGKAVAGEIGPSDFRKFGVFGPVVNLASRLEGMTKIINVPILIDDNTAKLIAKYDPQCREFQVRRFPVVRPAGMTVETRIYELAERNTYGADFIGIWEDAVNFFERGKWSRAADKLDELEGHSDSSASKTSISSLSNFLSDYMNDEDFQRVRDTPEFLKNWTGVIKFDRKS